MHSLYIGLLFLSFISFSSYGFGQENLPPLEPGIFDVEEILEFERLSRESREESEPTPEEIQIYIDEFIQSLSPRQGVIELSSGHATLEIPEGFIYLDTADSKKILEEAWGNPPNEYVIGMILPDDRGPFDHSSWGVTIEYVADGYISDRDASSINYNDLLEVMKNDMDAENELRLEQGYERVDLVGWAVQPFYDEKTHKLHWAKELQFGDQETRTLNYNIRVLGRGGYLVLNFIAGMDQFTEIQLKLEDVLAMAEFDQGSRYSDFDPSIDKVAAYGIGGLVAGKVLAKTGFFAMALAFLKKFGVYIFIALAALGAKIRRNLFRKKEATE